MAKIYKIGAKGLEVARIQSALNAHGIKPTIRVDGGYGTETAAAVSKFQELNHLKVDGAVGPETRGALLPFKKLIITGKARGDIPDAQMRLIVPKQQPLPPTAPMPLPIPYPNLPVSPSSPTPSTAKGGGWVQQVQGGGQANFKPWFYNQGPSPSDVWSGIITFAFVYRTRPEGMHFEFAPQLQLAVNSSNPNLTFSGGLQVTWADIYAPGSWHILSPFAQAMLIEQGDAGFQATIGNQISWEFVKDRWQIFGQPGMVATWDFNTGQLTIGPQIILGVIAQF